MATGRLLLLDSMQSSLRFCRRKILGGQANQVVFRLPRVVEQGTTLGFCLDLDKAEGQKRLLLLSLC